MLKRKVPFRSTARLWRRLGARCTCRDYRRSVDATIDDAGYFSSSSALGFELFGKGICQPRHVVVEFIRSM